MDQTEFTKLAPGRLVKIPGEAWAFVPNPVPPPKVFESYDSATAILLSQADRAFSELNGIGQLLPNPHLLIGPFLKREAILSSLIEGTVTSVEQLLVFEADPPDRHEQPDQREVQNYVIAMEYGLERRKTLPMSLRLIRELHQKLLEGVRGKNKRPGEFRKEQNHITGNAGRSVADARYVPPPVPQMVDALDNFEKFLVSQWKLPPIVALALIHYQFEAIHPFLDGNGRIGRLLITLLMIEKNLMTQPLLYMSAYFARYKDKYNNSLLSVSQTGNWFNWIKFFATGIAEQSTDAVNRSNQLLNLQKNYKQRLHSKRTSALVLRHLDDLFKSPWSNMKRAAKFLDASNKTAQKVIDRLVAAEILKEATGQRRNRIYVAPEIIKIIEQDNLV